MSTIEKLKKQIAELSQEDRNELMWFLMPLNGYEWVTGDDSEWEAELNRRWAEFENGKDPGRPGEEVMAEIREKLAIEHRFQRRSEEVAEPDESDEWLAELDRRAEEMRSGRDPGVPAEEVFAEMRRKYGEANSVPAQRAKRIRQGNQALRKAKARPRSGIPGRSRGGNRKG
jgi:putative addiction module component (TIGR02574 family)